MGEAPEFPFQFWEDAKIKGFFHHLDPHVIMGYDIMVIPFPKTMFFLNIAICLKENKRKDSDHET